MVTGHAPAPAPIDDLDLALADCWRILQCGVRDSRAPAHTPALATIGLDGRPRARTVVLRGADPAAWTLQVHTDRRSPKYAEIERDPRVALMIYDASARIQLRAEGLARLHRDDAVAATAWHATRAMSRVCYAQLAPPSAAAADPAAAVAGSPDGDAFAVGNFAVIRITVDEIEWLHLAHTGHRRARFVAGCDGTASATWLSP